ncbi:hypothetical protein DNTS_011922 [Danionella cerebrum]|uniref:Uncharacterized protein n=1 Tax=Danionella cerebrum TaxID=2873325 RepID=A0A553Q7J7_9TELE|nr:hypothetical protein DNTS_011922 [Danionella translucida]
MKRKALLGAGVFRDGLGALGHSVFGQLPGEQETHGGLDLSGADGRAFVVVSEARSFTGDALEDVVHERVHDAHRLGGDSGVGVDLLQYLVHIGVLEQTHQISLAGLLQSHDGGALEAQVGLEVLGDLSHQPLEGQLADQQLGGLLVTADLSKSHGSWSVTVGLLNTAGSRKRFYERLWWRAASWELFLRQQHRLDIGQHAALSDGHSAQEFVQLLVVTHGQLQMTGDDASLLVVPSGVTG